MELTMTANDLMMFLVDLHMQGNNLEEIDVSFRSHGDSHPEKVLFVEEGLQHDNGVPMEIMLCASELDEDTGTMFQRYFDSI